MLFRSPIFYNFKWNTIYKKLNHYVVHLKPIQYCKSTIRKYKDNILIRLAYIYLYTHKYSIVKNIMERTSYILLVGLQIDAASLEAGASLMDQMVKNLPTMQETWV